MESLNKMCPKIKEKWLTALKSGEYNKGKQMLQTRENEFCCLGVLCDIYKNETGLGEWVEGTADVGIARIPALVFIVNYSEHGELLPVEVSVWAGFTYNGDSEDKLNPFTMLLNKSNHPETLAEINDRTETFAEVIEQIEQF